MYTRPLTTNESMQHEHSPWKTWMQVALGATGIFVLGVSVVVGASLTDDLCSTQTVVGSELLGPYDGYVRPGEPVRAESMAKRDDVQWTPANRDDSDKETLTGVLMSTTKAWSASAIQ